MLYTVSTTNHVESVEADHAVVHEGKLFFRDDDKTVVACFNDWEFFVPTPAPDPEDFATLFDGFFAHEPLQTTEHVDPHGIGLDGVCDECDDPFDQENWLPESTVLQLLGRFGLPPWPDGEGGWLGENVDCAPLASEMADAVEAAIAEDLGETCSSDLDSEDLDLDPAFVMLFDIITDDDALRTFVEEAIFGRNYNNYH